ncbi:MAG: hypothetical protein ABJG41_01510 [Cyclobacteriaceae bacterium]
MDQNLGLFDQLHPAIISDFPLEKMVEGMSDQEKKAFYKGFSKCYTTTIKAQARTSGVYILPKDRQPLLEHISTNMIDVLAETQTTNQNQETL